MAESAVRPLGLGEQTTRNYLLLQFQSALGTVVHATPVAAALRRAVPGAQIIVAASGLAAQVWQGNPSIDRLVEVPNPLQNLRACVTALRGLRLFDGEACTILLTTGNERTKITLAAVLAGPSHRVGFAVRQQLVMPFPLTYDPALSQIANNLRLLHAVLLPTAGNTEPVIDSLAEQSYAEQLLGARTHTRIALATQTSVTQRKSWRAERWIELAVELRARHDAELVFVGTAAESPAIDALRARIPFETVSVAGRTTIAQLASVLALCDAGVVLDTGPLHVARAVGLPAVVIAPAWSPPHEWLPVGNPRYRILKNRDFLPPAPEDYVIDEVSVAEVLTAVAELLINSRAA